MLLVSDWRHLFCFLISKFTRFAPDVTPGSSGSAQESWASSRSSQCEVSYTVHSYSVWHMICSTISSVPLYNNYKVYNLLHKNHRSNRAFNCFFYFLNQSIYNVHVHVPQWLLEDINLMWGTQLWNKNSWISSIKKRHITLRKVENFNAVTLHVAVLHLSVKTWEYLNVCYKIILSDSKVRTSLWDVNLCDVVKSFLTLGEQLSCLQRK